MDENNYNDVLINIQLEGNYFYENENNLNDYFIAYKLILIATDQDNEDCEGELYNRLKSVINDENLIFTCVGANSETHRIIGVPEIEYFEFENSNYTILENATIFEAIDFINHLKTIDFMDLNSKKLYNKKNYKSVE